jgi:aspartate/methionine/tyrosine aminotransferase
MTDRERRARDMLHARRAEIAPFIAMDVMSSARRLEGTGRHVVHMEIGEPGTGAPKPAIEAAMARLARGGIGYTEALGLPELRSRISRHYREMYGLDVAAERIAVTTGSSSGFVLAFLAMFDPGQRVAIASPGYPPYRTILQALGLEPVEIEVGHAQRWALDGEAVARAHAERPLDGLLIMSPANPSGTMIDASALEGIATTCRDLGIRLISDEIYHGLTYGMAAESALRFDDDAVIINSFSKYWCMTGWRVGWMVLPESLLRPVERLAQNLFISAPTLSQVAAIAAMDAHEELAAVHGGYARNRDLLMRELPKAGIDRFLPPDGAFYLYADIGNLTNDSAAFATAMLDEAAVAATPGMDFDPARGARFLRFSYAGSEADIADAVQRIAGWRAGKGQT